MPYRIVDLSRYLPGPYCTRILADLGAEVIKVEKPISGDPLRSFKPITTARNSLFDYLNHGKKSIVLDLAKPQDKNIFVALVKTADVLVESFRPGIMHNFGLDYSSISEINPGIIYCSLSGYGQRGVYREKAGHDLNYSALAGLIDLTGYSDKGPSVPGTQTADILGGLWAAVSIQSALLSKNETGKGNHLDVSLFGAVYHSLPTAITAFIDGQPFTRGAGPFTGGLVCYQLYKTSDNRYMSLAALEPKFWKAFCREIGKEVFYNMQFSPAVPGDPVFDELSRIFLTKSQNEWRAVFTQTDACCEPVLTIGETVNSEILGQPLPSTHKILPPTDYLSNEKPIPQAPTLGEHTDSILTELGFLPDRP